MKRSYRNASVDFVMVFVLSMYTVLSLGCGTIDANGFLGLEPCEILNCDGLFFSNLAEDHDEAEADSAAGHDEEGEDQVDGVDDHDDAGVDDAEEDGHDDAGVDDAEEDGHDEETEVDDGSGPA